MSNQCEHPFVAVNQYTDSTDKKHIKIFSKSRFEYNLQDLKKRYGSDNVYVFNCGHCEACRKKYASEWSVRCACEATEHPYNYFLTLTYDNQHIDYACKKDLDKFLDRISGKNHKNKFKYFACMERGELGRLHFHVALFCDFEFDLYDATKINGFYYYHSHFLDDKWTFGLTNIAPFQNGCAHYIAKYASKDNSAQLFMSRNLGKSYFTKHCLDIIKDDFKLYGQFDKGTCVNIPQAFVRWFLELDAPGIDKFKDFKKSLAHLCRSYSMRDIQALHEEDLIRFDIANEKKSKDRRFL